MNFFNPLRRVNRKTYQQNEFKRNNHPEISKLNGFVKNQTYNCSQKPLLAPQVIKKIPVKAIKMIYTIVKII